MGVNPTKVQFATPAFTVDKIAAYANNLGNSFPASIPTNISYSGIPGSGNNASTTYTTKTLPNPYGKRLLTTFSWSVDGANYYDQGAQLYYFSSFNQQWLVQMQAYCGCSDSTIYFSFGSQYTANQTVYIQFAVDSTT